jgi:hypothetical protein
MMIRIESGSNPPPSWVWAPPLWLCPMSVVLSLGVSGGGLPPAADPAGGPVDGAGAGALDTALALAPGADWAAPQPALDVPGALAAGAGAERAQAQEPPHGGRGSRRGDFTYYA